MTLLLACRPLWGNLRASKKAFNLRKKDQNQTYKRMPDNSWSNYWWTAASKSNSRVAMAKEVHQVLR